MSKIFDSIEISQEVSDNVDETVKILDIIEKEKERLNKLNLGIMQYAAVLEIIIDVAKEYKKL